MKYLASRLWAKSVTLNWTKVKYSKMRILQLLKDEFTRWLFVLEWMTLTAGCLPQNRPTPPPPLSVKVWSKLLSLKSLICYILVCEKRMVVKASFVKKTLGTVFSFSEFGPLSEKIFFNCGTVSGDIFSYHLLWSIYTESVSKQDH